MSFRQLGGPFTDVRVQLPPDWSLVPTLPNLISIDLHPPASGPEIELTFATVEGAEPAPEEYIKNEVERILRSPVLAIRRREGEVPSGTRNSSQEKEAIEVERIAHGAVDRLCAYDAWDAPGDFDRTADRIALFLGDFVRTAATRLAGVATHGEPRDPGKGTS